jgi:hypothetical protein
VPEPAAGMTPSLTLCKINPPTLNKAQFPSLY